MENAVMKLQETENMVVPVLKNQLAELEESGIISDMNSTGEPEKSTCDSKCFFQRCVPQAERDVSCGSDARFAHEVCLGT